MPCLYTRDCQRRSQIGRQQPYSTSPPACEADGLRETKRRELGKHARLVGHATALVGVESLVYLLSMTGGVTPLCCVARGHRPRSRSVTCSASPAGAPLVSVPYRYGTAFSDAGAGDPEGMMTL
jgi:hypothetical protein